MLVHQMSWSMTFIFRMLLSEAIQNVMIVRNCPQLDAEAPVSNECRKSVLHLCSTHENEFQIAQVGHRAIQHAGVSDN